jgi:adenylate kinase
MGPPVHGGSEGLCYDNGMVAALLVFASLLRAETVAPVAAPVPVFSAPLGLVVTGRPASGKGTHGVALAGELGLVHISAGDLLRAHAKTHPEVEAVMKQGGLVPTALVVGLVRERLQQPDVRAQGYMLDGFPRRMEEVDALERMIAEGLPLDGHIHLDVPIDELRRRARARGRADDDDKVFDDRQRVYDAQTAPAVARLSRLVTTVKPDVSAPDKQANYLKVREALLDAVEKARALMSRGGS